MSEKISLPLIGGLLAGIATSLCCVAPLILLSLGVGGAWVSNLTALEPYRPLFIVIAIFALIIAYFQLFLSASEPCCDEDKMCAKPSTQSLTKNVFWAVVTVVIAAIASPYLIAFIYG
ncbi:MAG: mercuric transporter MerT family protein [Methylobacter sp.]